MYLNRLVYYSHATICIEEIERNPGNCMNHKCMRQNLNINVSVYLTTSFTDIHRLTLNNYCSLLCNLISAIFVSFHFPNTNENDLICIIVLVLY